MSNDPTPVTVLYFDDNVGSQWNTGKPEHIHLEKYNTFFGQTYSVAPLPVTLAINGHSVGNNTIEDLTAENIAESLATKYISDKSRLKNLILLACSTSVVTGDNNVSFAQSLANELDILGFKDVIIHAPPPVAPEHFSRLLINPGYSFTATISYYEVPNTDLKKFDESLDSNQFIHIDWVQYRKIHAYKYQLAGYFPDSYMKATDKYNCSPVLLIQDNIDQFYSKIWKFLYDLFQNLGSTIHNKKNKLDEYDQLRGSFGKLIKLNQQRASFQEQIPSGSYTTWGRTTSIGFFKDFLSSDIFQDNNSYKDGIIQNSNRISKSKTEVTLSDPKKTKITAKNLLEFYEECQEEFQKYQQLLASVKKHVSELKKELVEQVKSYNASPNLNQEKKDVMNALIGYLEEKEPTQIKNKQKELFQLINRNPSWSEGLISKRSRTAVESAIEIMKIEDSTETFRSKK